MSKETVLCMYTQPRVYTAVLLDLNLDLLKLVDLNLDLQAWIYCFVEKIRTRDVARPLARQDHRKSKFGLRHAIKLN